MGTIAVLLALAAQGRPPETDPARVLEPSIVRLERTIGGPKLTGDDLPGRPVLYVFATSDAKNPAWTEFLVRTTHKYMDLAPPGALAVVFVVQEKSTDAAWWAAARGNPRVAFVPVDAFHMPGFVYVGLPRYLLVDGDGRIVSHFIVDGRDLAGNSIHSVDGPRLTAEVMAKAVESSGVPGRDLAEAALVSAPLSPVLKGLRDKARNGKGAEKAAAASALAGFKEYLDRQAALVDRNADGNPYVARKALDRLLVQLQGDETRATFEKLDKRLREDKARAEELKASEALAAVRLHAARVKWGVWDPDWPVRPKEDVAAIRRAIDEIPKKWPKSRAARTAEALRMSWTRWVAKAIDPLPWDTSALKKDPATPTGR